MNLQKVFRRLWVARIRNEPVRASNDNQRCDGDGRHGLAALREGNRFRLVLVLPDSGALPVASATGWKEALEERATLCDQLRVAPVLTRLSCRRDVPGGQVASRRRGSLARPRRARFLTRRQVGARIVATG